MPLAYYGILLVPQKPAGGYRIDLAVYPHRLAIEIDGHDYHERTKDQATRGKRHARDLQLLNWTVLPYTGSDVWNDLFGCCQDVNRFIARQTAGQDGQSGGAGQLLEAAE